ncbi:MAG: hypothetical protein LBO20_10045 [Bifidobacteriaceae bacterium]|jgi:hypothetical protein|nr:hypothetical protein [Bifidobacteriaceae bacterium]
MMLPRTVAEVVADHVVFEVECFDRLYLNLYQPKLQYAQGLVGYVKRRLGLPIASTAPLAAKTEAFSKAVRAFAAQGGIPWVDFKKGQRKDDITLEFLAGHDGAEAVLYIGRAQEKANVFQTEKRRNPATGATYPWIVSTTRIVNHYYFYCFDDDFGPFFIKFCSYFPYTARLCVNGHEWAKRQASKAGIAFTALDNAFGEVAPEDVPKIQAICDQLGPTQIETLVRKWLTILPDPFDDADRAAGHHWDISVLQAEFSLTQVLDRPVSGRIFFEQAIRDNLDIGRPSKIGLVFDKRIHSGRKRATLGRFRTRVITDGVTPSIHAEYKHATIKQYHKEGRALRTETTINNTYDFGIGRRLTNLPAIREVGLQANRRLLSVQRLSFDPIQGRQAFQAVTQPAVTDTGTRVAGLRFGDQRADAALRTLTMFRHHADGFTAADFKTAAGQLRAEPLTSGQATYDLRRLRVHGLIARRPHTRRYDVTDQGLRQALLITHVHDRVLQTGLAQLAEPVPNPLNTAHRKYADAINQLITTPT